MGASSSWNPQGMSRPVMGRLYHYLYRPTMKYVCLLHNSLLTIIPPMYLTNSKNRTKRNPTQISCPVSAVPQRFFYHVPEHDNSIAYNVSNVETSGDSCDAEDS
jgi:hypothetical protein